MHFGTHYHLRKTSLQSKVLLVAGHQIIGGSRIPEAHGKHFLECLLFFFLFVKNEIPNRNHHEKSRVTMYIILFEYVTSEINDTRRKIIFSVFFSFGECSAL